MMILIAVGDEDSFQVVSMVDSVEEAHSMAAEYCVLGPDNDCLAPLEFQVHARGNGGFYTVMATFEP